MTRRSQTSKRRWIARIRAGKWVPSAVIYALDKRQDLGDTYEMHPTEWGFMRLRRSAKVAWVEKESPMKSMRSFCVTREIQLPQKIGVCSVCPSITFTLILTPSGA